MNVVISNLLITRVCPLKCENCRVSKDYEGSPYPSIDSYKLLTPVEWLENIKILESLGCVFQTIYGGEPVVYPWLEKLVKLLNDNDVYYTFITSGLNSKRWFEIQKEIGIKGISASVDIIPNGGDRGRKSSIGEVFLYEMKKLRVPDVVAVTVLDESNIQIDNVLGLIKRFSDNGIYVEITLMDEPKSEWYDFAEETGLSIKSKERFNELMGSIKKMKELGYLIHNNTEFFDVAKDVIVNGYYCKRPYTSLTVEPDGVIRTCYRLGGREVRKYKVQDLVHKEEEILEAFEKDRKELCGGCVWNCVIQSEFMMDKQDKFKSFRHNQ